MPQAGHRNRGEISVPAIGAGAIGALAGDGGVRRRSDELLARLGEEVVA
jgi:hypothetical protein